KDRYYVEAVIKVLAEFAVLDGLLQVLVAGGHQPDVNRDILAAADFSNYPFLQNAEQFYLEVLRQGVYLVEEQGSALSFFDESAPGLVGAGKGAFLMTEQLGLEQGLRDGRAVDGYKGGVSPVGVIVDSSGHELLSGAGRAYDERG